MFQRQRQNNDFFGHTKVERISHQQTQTTRIIERSRRHRGKRLDVNLDHEESQKSYVWE